MTTMSRTASRLNLSQHVADYLKEHSGEKFTARQLAEWIFGAFPAECQAKKAKSRFIDDDSGLIQQLVAEISARYPQLQKRHPELKTTEGRPRRYYHTTLSEQAEVAAAEAGQGSGATCTQSPRPDEHALYPLLAQYLHAEFGLHTMRIDEKRASNRNGPSGNHWLYPDMASLENLGNEWTREVSDCAEECAARRCRLWSFEVKRFINRANVRECFFQAVSNSSWAHFGYLVAAELSGSDTLKELRMLAATHGIGFIELDTDNPSESQVLIPAREREALDWDMVNRLATANRDFSTYVQRVWQFHRNRGIISPGDWGLANQTG